MDKMQQWLDAQAQERTPWGAMGCTQRLVERSVHGLIACRKYLSLAPAWLAALDVLATHPVIVHAGIDGAPPLHADSHALWISEGLVAELLEESLTMPHAWQQPAGARRPAWDADKEQSNPLHLRLDPLACALVAQAHAALSPRSSGLLLEKHGSHRIASRSMGRVHATQLSTWARRMRALGLPPAPARPKVREFQRASLSWLRTHGPHLLSWAPDAPWAQRLRDHLPWAGVDGLHPLHRHAWYQAVWRAMKECRSKNQWNEAFQMHALGAWALPAAVSENQLHLAPWEWREFTEQYIESSAMTAHHAKVREALQQVPPRSNDPRLHWSDALWWLTAYRAQDAGPLPEKAFSCWLRDKDEGAHAPSPWIFQVGCLPDWTDGQLHAIATRQAPWKHMRLPWHGLASEAAAWAVLNSGVLPHHRYSPQAPTLLDVIMHRHWSPSLFERALDSAHDVSEQQWRRHGLMRQLPGSHLSLVLKSTPLLGQATRGSHVRALLERFPASRNQVTQALTGVYPLTSHISGVYRELLVARPEQGPTTIPRWLVHAMKQQASAKAGRLDRLGRTGLVALIRWMRVAQPSLAADFPWTELWGCSWVHNVRLWQKDRYKALIWALVDAACRGQWEGQPWETVFLSATHRAPNSSLVDALRGWKTRWEQEILRSGLPEKALKNEVSRKRV